MVTELKDYSKPANDEKKREHRRHGQNIGNETDTKEMNGVGLEAVVIEDNRKLDAIPEEVSDSATGLNNAKPNFKPDGKEIETRNLNGLHEQVASEKENGHVTGNGNVTGNSGLGKNLTVENMVEGKIVAMDVRRSLTDLSNICEENEDVPTYLPREFRSRRGFEIGSENLITNDDLLLAATLVADARSGQSHDLKTEPRFVSSDQSKILSSGHWLNSCFVTGYPTTLNIDDPDRDDFQTIVGKGEKCWSYNLFKSRSMRFSLYGAIIVNLFLALFEEPAYESIALPYWVTMIAEGICLVIFTARLTHHAHWRLLDSFKKDARNITAFVCIIVTVIDIIAYIFVLKFSPWKPIRWSRVLRPLLIMNFSDGTHLRRAWSNIRLTIHEITHVIVLFYFLIVVFALVAMKMFQHRTNLKYPDGKPYFKTYDDSFWKLYVLVTTANNPDVMLPAYDSNRLNFVFFTIYIILCLYLMLNILLAVTYNSFRENMKIQIRQSARQKKKSLNQAFEVIKINLNRKEMVTYKTWSRLIRLALPRKTKYQIDLLMMVLDTDKTGYISREQFLSVSDLLNVPISQVSERKTFLEIHFPKLYLSKPSAALRKAVSTIYFSLFYDGVVLINVILICLDISSFEWGFFAAYFLEIVLKWYTIGTKRYFGQMQHWSDVIITLSSLIVLIITNTDLARSGRINPETLRVINVFRIFRILRCLVEFERFRIIFDCVINVSFSIFTYCGILFIVFYAFAIVGMEIFSGKIQYLGYTGDNSSSPTTSQLNCNNSALEGSAFVQNRYCNINFNDLFSSFFVLASLLIVNNWHIIAEGFCLVTNKAARVYFMFFHLCVAVVVMNVVTAFILDMFMHEYTFTKKGNIDTKVEMTIKNLKLGMDDETGEDINEKNAAQGQERESTKDSVLRRMTIKQRVTTRPNLSRYDGIRFHIKQRSWTKTELLLEQLFAVDDEDDKNEEEHAN